MGPRDGRHDAQVPQLLHRASITYLDSPEEMMSRLFTEDMGPMWYERRLSHQVMFASNTPRFRAFKLKRALDAVPMREDARERLYSGTAIRFLEGGDRDGDAGDLVLPEREAGAVHRHHRGCPRGDRAQRRHKRPRGGDFVAHHVRHRGERGAASRRTSRTRSTASHRSISPTPMRISCRATGDGQQLMWSHQEHDRPGTVALFPVKGGHIVCGGAQNIYLVEFDGPQRRKYVEVIGE